MKSKKVLIVGQSNEQLDRLMNMIFDAGYQPVIRNRIDRLSSIIHRQDFVFAAVLCDQDAVDSIETVLTIRDYRSDLPVIVIESKPNERTRRILNEVPQVIYVPFIDSEVIHAIES